MGRGDEALTARRGASHHVHSRQQRQRIHALTPDDRMRPMRRAAFCAGMVGTRRRAPRATPVGVRGV
jgi:hypothetical protein